MSETPKTADQHNLEHGVVSRVIVGSKHGGMGMASAVEAAIACARQQLAKEILAAVRKEYPEVTSVEPCGTYEATMEALRARGEKWDAFCSRWGM